MNINSGIHAGTLLPVDDTVLFRRGPFNGQKLRVPFGPMRHRESGLAIGNQIALYRPVWERETLQHFEFIEIVDKPPGWS